MKISAASDILALGTYMDFYQYSPHLVSDSG